MNHIVEIEIREGIGCQTLHISGFSLLNSKLKKQIINELKAMV